MRLVTWTLAVAAGPCAALAQAPGAFTPTGNMTTPRSSHVAALLPNGKILIAGGWQANPPPRLALDSAEIYDPSTGAFTFTGNMTTGRFNATGTLLPTGKVLIVGGMDGYFGHLASAELYDPSRGTFSATGEMITARVGHTATLLNTGKVLIAGGGVNYSVSAELYDPAIGTFTGTGNMTTVRASPTSTLLPDGKVLIAGGDYPNPSAEVYDPEAGTFRLVSGMIGSGPGGPLTTATATLLTNGKVLSTLRQDEGPDNAADIYDPATGMFTATGNMTVPRAHTATLLPEGTVLIAGYSWLFNLDGRPSVDIYDPGTGTFSGTGDLLRPRWSHTATLLPDGTVLISGGYYYNGTTLASAELYHPAKLISSPVLSQGAILHSGTYEVVSPDNPALVGEALEIYCTGLMDGSLIPPQVDIGRRMAEVLFFGNAPGFTGLNQVNVRVPNGVTPGPAVPVRLTYLSRPTNEVTIGVR